MLTKSQKEKIRSINLFEYAIKEKKGKAINWDGSEFVLPTLRQVEDSIYEQILKMGFTKIERVAPNQANCIIRVFQKLHYPYPMWPGREDIYNVYGAACFTLRSGKWISTGFNTEGHEINYSEWKIRHWLCQDEYIEFDFDFFDCYVKIS